MDENEAGTGRMGCPAQDEKNFNMQKDTFKKIRQFYSAKNTSRGTHWTQKRLFSQIS